MLEKNDQIDPMRGFLMMMRVFHKEGTSKLILKLFDLAK
ncbi:hypothetical protein J2S08_002036 [Bacillus chungangensis]|uniref:Transposase n=1 Tax=Bacillus chungangensis TaxID=587633 RepID=A0ABT9WSC4_9BACI|nr:hypothetical protein [Bacillus chungangensis]